MNDTPTPRTDAELFLSREIGTVPTLPREVVRIAFSRTLERELTAVTEQRDVENQRIIEDLAAVTEQRDSYNERYTKLAGKYAVEIHELTEQRDSIDSMYQKIIKEVLECDPIPACKREEDQLEPPWEVIARIKKERDEARETLAELRASVLDLSHPNIKMILSERQNWSDFNRNQHIKELEREIQILRANVQNPSKP